MARAFPAFAMAFQLSVLDLNAGPVRRLGGEPHFPLTGPARRRTLPLSTLRCCEIAGCETGRARVNSATDRGRAAPVG